MRTRLGTKLPLTIGQFDQWSRKFIREICNRDKFNEQPHIDFGATPGKGNEQPHIEFMVAQGNGNGKHDAPLPSVKADSSINPITSINPGGFMDFPEQGILSEDKSNGKSHYHGGRGKYAKPLETSVFEGFDTQTPHILPNRRDTKIPVCILGEESLELGPDGNETGITIENTLQSGTNGRGHRISDEELKDIAKKYGIPISAGKKDSNSRLAQPPKDSAHSEYWRTYLVNGINDQREEVSRKTSNFIIENLYKYAEGDKILSEKGYEALRDNWTTIERNYNNIYILGSLSAEEKANKKSQLRIAKQYLFTKERIRIEAGRIASKPIVYLPSTTIGDNGYHRGQHNGHANGGFFGRLRRFGKTLATHLF